MYKNKLSTAGQLQALLADERKALLSGDLTALPAFIGPKETLMSSPDLMSAPQEELENLQSAAKSNQALLEAALKGVQAARERIEIAKSGGASLSTYTAQGKSSAHSAPQSKIERRA